MRIKNYRLFPENSLPLSEVINSLAFYLILPQDRLACLKLIKVF
jgi:hypothetical protein